MDQHLIKICPSIPDQNIYKEYLRNQELKRKERASQSISREKLALWFREDFPMSIISFKDLHPVVNYGWIYWIPSCFFIDYLIPDNLSVELGIWNNEDFPMGAIGVKDEKSMNSGWFDWKKLDPYVDYLILCKHNIELGSSCYSFNRKTKIWCRRPAEEQRKIYLKNDPKFVVS